MSKDRADISNRLKTLANNAGNLSEDLVAAAKQWALRNAAFQQRRADVKDAEAALEDEQNIFVAVLEAEYAAAKADKGHARLTASTADGRKAQIEELLIKARTLESHPLRRLSQKLYAAKEQMLKADIDLATSRATLEALQAAVALHVQRFEMMKLALTMDERALYELTLLAPKEAHE